MCSNVWGSTILFTKEGIVNNNGIESFHSFIFKVSKFEQISTTLCQTLPSGKTTSWQGSGKLNIKGHFSFPFLPAELKSWSPLVILGLVILDNIYCVSLQFDIGFFLSPVTLFSWMPLANQLDLSIFRLWLRPLVQDIWIWRRTRIFCQWKYAQIVWGRTIFFTTDGIAYNNGI